MENAAEALKIAGAMLMFVLALTLSISSFSSANASISAITTMYDKDTKYIYVKPAKNFTRTVGVEAIIPTMYQAYEESIEIYFKDKNGNPLPLYYKTDQYGKRVDSNGNVVDNSSTSAVTINYINLKKEEIGNDKGRSAEQVAADHLSMILAGKNNWKRQYSGNSQMLDMLNDNKYGNQFMESVYPNGLYEFLKDKTFIENLGEYYQGNDSAKIKKRVITYQMK